MTSISLALVPTVQQIDWATLAVMVEHATSLAGMELRDYSWAIQCDPLSHELSVAVLTPTERVLREE